MTQLETTQHIGDAIVEKEEKDGEGFSRVRITWSQLQDRNVMNRFYERVGETYRNLGEHTKLRTDNDESILIIYRDLAFSTVVSFVRDTLNFLGVNDSTYLEGVTA